MPFQKCLHECFDFLFLLFVCFLLSTGTVLEIHNTRYLTSVICSVFMFVYLSSLLVCLLLLSSLQNSKTTLEQYYLLPLHVVVHKISMTMS